MIQQEITIDVEIVENVVDVEVLEQGPSGAEIELQKGTTYIQWRYVGEETWQNLIAIADLKGDQGDKGDDGADGQEVQLRNNGTYIQWKYENDINWVNLIEIALLKGDKGDPGENGQPGASLVWKGAFSAIVAYVVNDCVSYLGSSYICKLASTGNLPTNTTYWNLLAQKGDDAVLPDHGDAGTILVSTGIGWAVAKLAQDEVPTGDVDDVNTIFTLAHTPLTGTLFILNFGTGTVFEGEDFARNGTQIITNVPPMKGTQPRATYYYLVT